MTIQASPYLPRRRVILVFLAFALAYFLSSLIRAITATLSPSLTAEFALSAQDLGLLAGGYFLGFSLTQLPLGRWLDLHGPKKVILAFLSVAVLGCLAFAWAEQFHSLLAARVLCGMGVSACLMAPLTAYRRWFDPNTQLRANSWMLMTGSTGMLAATLPVQWLMPLWGWRPLFIVLAAMVVVTMAMVLLLVPHWSHPSQRADTVTLNTTTSDGYRLIWQSPYFWRMVPIGFFCHGGMVAIQTLWAGQWMTQVAGWNATDAAGGLFVINLGMLISFWLWGLITPRLAKAGVRMETLIAWCLPMTFAALLVLVTAGPAVGSGAAAVLTVFCVGSSVVSLIQPAVGLKFPVHLAGRALSAYNLVVLSGIFCVQWGIGLVIDLGLAMGLPPVMAYRVALMTFAVCSVLSWLYFILKRVRPGSAPKPLNPGP